MRGQNCANLEAIDGSIQLAEWLLTDKSASLQIDQTSEWIASYYEACQRFALSIPVKSKEQLAIKARILARHLCSSESLSDDAITAFADMVTYIMRDEK